MSYIVPQVLINQLISEVPLNTVKNQNVLVIGPNYELFRFDNADEKAKTYIGEYVNQTGQEGGGEVLDQSGVVYSADNGNAYPNVALQTDNLRTRDVIGYPSQAAATIPDADYSKLFADEVTIKIASLGDFYLFDDETTAGLDARFRFPFVIASNNKAELGKMTALYKICDSVIDPDTGACISGHCGTEDGASFHWEIELTGDEPSGHDPILRSINPGDVIRIPYNGTDGKNGVYRSTVVEVLESVPGTGVFDTVQMADTLPDNFPLGTADGPVDEYHPNSVAYQVPYFNANGSETIGPASDDVYGSNDCEDSAESEEGADSYNVVQLCAQFSDVEIPRKTDVRHVWNWSPYAYEEAGYEDVYGVVVTGNLRVEYLNWGGYNDDGSIPEYRVLTAKLYVQHRDLVTANANEITSIASHTLVESTLGTVHPDNPLAFGTYMAALNSGDRLVYFCGVQTDDLNGYNMALDKATLTDEVYIICPTTMDTEVIQSVKAHCLEMSTAQNKLWRIGFVAMDPPDADMIYDHTNQPSGEDFFCRVALAKGKNPVKDGANIVQFMKSSDSDDSVANTTVRFLTEVKVGDVVKIWLKQQEDDWDDTPHYTERYVSKVLSNNTLQLSKGIKECYAVCQPDTLAEGTFVGSFDPKTGKALDTIYSIDNYKVEIYRKLTPTQQVEYIAAQSSSLATRRMYNVFPSIASNAGVSFDGSFLACAAAGLVSSVLPQQPVTNVEINGVDDIPIVYQTYTKAQLDTIAAGGTFIIMQDRPNSKVYVRHQISTDYTSNNLLKAELSITKNLDSISYYFAELFAPYIGKYNITPDLIGALGNVLTTGLTALETDTAAGMYGPQVLEEGTEILWLRQSAANRDHVECRVHLNLPVPFNYFDLDLEI